MPGLQQQGARAIQRIEPADEVVAGDDARDVACVVVLADKKQRIDRRTAHGPGGGDAVRRGARDDIMPGLDLGGLVERQRGVGSNDVLAGRDDDRLRIVGMQRLGEVGQRHAKRVDVTAVGHGQALPEVDGAGGDDGEGSGIVSGLARIWHQVGACVG